MGDDFARTFLGYQLLLWKILNTEKKKKRYGLLPWGYSAQALSDGAVEEFNRKLPVTLDSVMSKLRHEQILMDLAMSRLAKGGIRQKWRTARSSSGATVSS